MRLDPNSLAKDIPENISVSRLHECTTVQGTRVKCEKAMTLEERKKQLAVPERALGFPKTLFSSYIIIIKSNQSPWPGDLDI